MDALPIESRQQIDDLVSFSIENLPSLRLPSGLYCHDVAFDNRTLRGSSLRYSLMVLLGLERAAKAGMHLPDDRDALWLRCLERRASFTPGDIGLAIWADSRRDGSSSEILVDQLGRALSNPAVIRSLLGMEIGWILIGLANAMPSGPGDALLRQVAAHLRGARRTLPGLYRHDVATRFRSNLPNFATEIYTLLALATLARDDRVPQAQADAEILAERLVRLRLDDGGWPWLFDAERGIVVEPYEIYTVHQDAMAPMAFLELADATGDQRWAREAVEGLAWSRGANQLGVDLLDREHAFAHRSIRRKAPWDRMLLSANALVGHTLGRRLAGESARVEVNATSRPYHLGWILEAWAGRQLAGSETRS
jgi:hypothetical protein